MTFAPNCGGEQKFPVDLRATSTGLRSTEDELKSRQIASCIQTHRLWYICFPHSLQPYA